ncbi:MAG: glycosyltransferase, partial [Deltaproteobacteria bacterium]|nr:glycosyltransferase [Deltaproteobacteria bacterium]
HDLVLISDSNVRVESDYLRRVVAHLDNDVGMVTAVVAGADAESTGGRLEATYLNTFYARWMFLAEKAGNTCVVGKSMLFSRKVAARFGGIRALGRYLAEDYMAGVAMRKIGQRVMVQSNPVRQHIGKYSVGDFWSRHIRWGRIRKSQAPAAFLFEPLLGSLVSAALGAWATHRAFGLSPQHFAILHFGLWSACDLLLMRRLDGALRLWMPGVWLLRELLAIPLWAHTLSGNTVSWRGRKLALEQGGLLKLS